MEWEPIHHNTMPSAAGTDTTDKENRNKVQLPTTNRQTKKRIMQNNGSTLQAVSDSERRMLHMLLPNDVLLLGRPALQHLVAGNKEYCELLEQFRSPFAQLPREQKQEIVHMVMATIWSQNGRFLQHDPLKGTISILSNEQAETIIRQNLKHAKRKHKSLLNGTVQKNKKKKSSKATKASATNKRKQKHRNPSSQKLGNRRNGDPKRVAASPSPSQTPIQNPFGIAPFTASTAKLFGRSASGTKFGDV
ncbi:hypothetical protein IV203_021465 [Nitzschia inconspicua]|uniref:DUF6824 domain-containing protein n=1 Tax=Nitzschia inconspicua TaxID=303405 RepID=A0A9K3KH64_9STRA|nr:hypothetical protein IV203_021465 [Nitzschia inconspicua]